MDLRTTYMGLTLRNPLVVSASPLSDSVDKIKRCEDAGAGALVMFSLFEEQFRQEEAVLDSALHAGTDSFAESLSYFPQVEDFHIGPDRYLEILSTASKACEMPIIASLNGTSNQGWIQFAKQIEQAGARGLELNIYYIPTETALPGAEVEQRYVDILRTVKASVKIPVALKLSPFFSSMANMAKRLDEAGADALVLFNRFYQPDFDLEELEVRTSLSLSTPYEIRLPLLWIAVLYGRIRASLGATRGVHSALEILKYVMAGADVAMTTSALLQRGTGHITAMLAELQEWMERHEYASVQQMKGCMSQRNVADPTAFERANYIRTLEAYKAMIRGQP